MLGQGMSECSECSEFKPMYSKWDKGMQLMAFSSLINGSNRAKLISLARDLFFN